MTTSDNIPDELKELEQWVCKAEDGKRPVTPSGRGTGHNPDNEWFSFSEVEESDRARGFVFTEDDKFVGIDLDGVRDKDTGELTEEAQEIVDRFNSWTEISTSGTGLHIIVKNPEFSTEEYPKQKTDDIEVYSHSRYFALTGDMFLEEDIKEVELPDLEWLMGKLDDKGQQSVIIPSEEMGNNQTEGEETDLSDEEVIKWIEETHPDLWNSPLGQLDDSAVDQGLMNIIAFYTNGDAQQTESVFLQSPRGDRYTNPEAYGDKINKGHRSKLEHTVDTAISSVSTSFTGNNTPPEKLEMDLDEALENAQRIDWEQEVEEIESESFRNLFNEGHLFYEYLEKTEPLYSKQEINFGTILAMTSIITDGFYQIDHKNPNSMVVLSGASSSGKTTGMKAGEELFKNIDIYDREFKGFITDDNWARKLPNTGSLVGMLRSGLDPKVNIEYEEVDGKPITDLDGIEGDEDGIHTTEYRPQRKKRFLWDDDGSSVLNSLSLDNSWSAIVTKLFEGTYSNKTVSQGEFNISNIYFNMVLGLQPSQISKYIDREDVQQGTIYRFSVFRTNIPDHDEVEVNTTKPSDLEMGMLGMKFSALWQVGKLSRSPIQFYLSDDAKALLEDYQEFKDSLDVNNEMKSMVSKSHDKIRSYALLFEITSESFIDECMRLTQDIYLDTLKTSFNEDDFFEWEKNKITKESQFFDVQRDLYSKTRPYITGEISEASMKKAIWYMDNVVQHNLLRFTEGVEDTDVVKFLNRIKQLKEEKGTNILKKREITRKCQYIEGIHYNSDQIFKYVSEMGNIKLVVPPKDYLKELRDGDKIPTRLNEFIKGYDFSKATVSREKWDSLEWKQSVYFIVIEDEEYIPKNYDIENPEEKIDTDYSF